MKLYTQKECEEIAARKDPGWDHVSRAFKQLADTIKAAQNVIDTFKIGDDMVKDGAPKFISNAIASSALHQLQQALPHVD